jgi:hypothetical protein
LKKLMLLAAILALVLVAAAPVIAQVNGPTFDDQEAESGGIETVTEMAIDGNNNNQCLGVLEFGNTGNIENQQGFTQYDTGDGGGAGGPGVSFAPENETACEQAVQQSAAASSAP